jgi:uncharacterized protein YjiK
MPKLRLFVLFQLLFITLSCTQGKQAHTSPPGYDLSKPYIIKMPAELEEISGIAYYSKDNSIFTESDGKGGLYKIFLNKPTDIRKWKFGHKRDYEDIVLHDSTFYVLNNNGDIVALNFLNDSLVARDFTFPSNGKNEFEGLYYDDKLDKLVLMCKDCESDKKSAVGTYTFDLKTYMYASAYTIDATEVTDATSPNSNRFKPSAANINPVTGELYILSSINKLLVVAERNGTIKELHHLDPALFNQPEGITFSANGNMFISNEGNKTRPATILFFQYKKPDNK